MQLLVGVIGSQKISTPIIIVTCGITKMFVGELVETGDMRRNFYLTKFVYSAKEISLALISNIICSSSCYGGEERNRTYQTVPYQRVLSKTKARRQSA